MLSLTRLIVLALCIVPWLASKSLAIVDIHAKDLNPVTFRPVSSADPLVELVKDGQPKAAIWARGGGDPVFMQKIIQEATGALLPIVKKEIPETAIVIGDCDLAKKHGLDGTKLPPEGFVIKTAPGYVFIVGNGDGLKWGCYEFLERFVGFRWYFPPATEGGPEIGQDVPKSKDLNVPPVWLADAPVFRKREMWPPVSIPSNGTGIKLSQIQTFLRAGSSWPYQLRVHQPNWSHDEQLKAEHPEVFQLRKGGKRDYNVLCYGNPETLKIYLEGIQNYLDKKGPQYTPISANHTITVSPADVELACYCDDCRRLWDNKGGQYGAASKVMATFVNNLANEVKKRWPKENFTILFLPYLNYTEAPDGFKFPGNVEVQICGMPGMASYKEPAIRESEQANIDKWVAISGRKIQNWHYDVWPANKTKAAYQYPHVIQDFYQANRDKTVGTFINGDFNHWPRQHISLYSWLKVLWNPNYNVDAAVDEFAKRMFGPAAGTMRQILAIQINGWEKSRWPGGRFSPKGIYEDSFPPEQVAKIKALFEQAKVEAKDDALVTARLDYYEPALKDFFEEADLMAGHGFQPLIAQKTGENPVIDGRLDEEAWSRAPKASFVLAAGANKGKKPKYSTTVQALWTTDGITFGFHLDEPYPDQLETSNGGHDNGNVWWDDNVELFLDVTGKSEGEFYQFIVNPKGNYWDSKLKDATWECKGFKTKSYIGKDYWSMEVFVPYAAFPDAKVPGSGTHTIWTGNFTRHRVVDQGNNPKRTKIEGSVQEYQRMNTTGSTTSNNLADFAEIRFTE